MWLYKVAYCGWEFGGSQVQPGRMTVEGELSRAVGGRCRLLSRTDAGVSARANVMALEDELELGRVNSQLRGVAVWAKASVEARPRVASRHYRYFLVGRSPEEARALERFNGTHDFGEFTPARRNQGRERGTRRTVEVRLGEARGVPYVDFLSRGFLWQQVRRMVGTLGGGTAGPEPLVLLGIGFEEEPDWQEERKWLLPFSRNHRGLLARSLVLEEAGNP